MTTFAAAVKNTTKTTLTENGMVTLDSSTDPCVDLFFAIGSSRGKDLSVTFARAFANEPEIAMKILFWARDVRGGAGERETFRKILLQLEAQHPDALLKNLSLVPEYGRWDDLLIFRTNTVKDKAYDLIAEALQSNNALAAKWMPRKGPLANELRKHMDLTPKAYRKLLVGLTKVVETQMCANEWSNINYNHVPSLASARYQKSFNKHDAERYAAWKAGLKNGTNKVNAAVLFPYDVIKSIDYNGDADVALAQWEALPNYLGDDRILPMVDVSGSMSCQVGSQKGVGLTCMDVSVSLGLYLADKQTGAFKDMFLTFSGDSRIEILKGNLLQKLAQIRQSDWGMNTSIENAYREILRVATENNVPADEMPRYLLILSDMEFDYACRNGSSVGAQTLAEKMFAAAGYQLPKIVYWNLNARDGNVPVKFNAQGTALVSGFSPSLVKSILSAGNFTPRDIMLETINSDRYQAISV